jgi:transposase
VISLAPGTKVFLACQRIDLRNGFDGLAAKVQQMIGADPFSGQLFLFRGKRGDYLKCVLGRHGALSLRQAAGEGPLRLAADRRRQHDADAGAIGAAHRGEGLPQDGGAAGATLVISKFVALGDHGLVIRRPL